MAIISYVPVTRPELPFCMVQKVYNENLRFVQVGPEGTVFAIPPHR
jgi:hypothetical protein